MADILGKNTVVGKWRLDFVLGRGGQATVWRVRYVDDTHTPRAALKISFDRSEKARSRFSREIKLLEAQSHPGIVRILDSGVHQGHPYFVMELATTTLAQVSLAGSAGTRLIVRSRELLLDLLREACGAVAHLHEHGILHRDIKPSNILLMLDPPEPIRAVISDLGIASPESEQGILTATFETVGTPSFRAPEALTGVHTKRSDVYSLGKTIDSVLNRSAPAELGPRPCLRDRYLTADLWDALDEVLKRACAFDPAARYADASALTDAWPRIVLGLEGSYREVKAQRQAKVALNVQERVTLSEIIGLCPAFDSRISLDAAKRQTRLQDYYFAISLRRLEDLQFVESTLEEDEDGARYHLIKPTSAGIRWAQDNHGEMVAALEETSSKTPSDDIPF